jgi:hypothetical protein
MFWAITLVLSVMLLAQSGASAAPVNGAAIGSSLQATMVEPVHCVPGWPHHRRGWDGCVRGPAIIAPVVPLIRGPVCRSVRVCDFRGCWWRRRC